MQRKLLQVCVLGVLTLMSISAHADADDQLKPEYIAGAAVSGTATAVAGASSLRYFDKTRALTASAAVARNQEKQVQLWAEAKAAQKKFWISSIAGLLSFAASFTGGLAMGDRLKEHSEETKIAPQTEKAKAFRPNDRMAFTSGQTPVVSSAAH